MRRLLRLLTLCLLALALPRQGAAAALGSDAPADAAVAPVATPTMVMPDGTTMEQAQMDAPRVPPCHGHGIDKTGCGACCGPLLVQQALPGVIPATPGRAQAPSAPTRDRQPAFLTGGTDRPPRPLLA